MLLSPARDLRYHLEIVRHLVLIKYLVEKLDRVRVIYYDRVTIEQVFVAGINKAGFLYG